MSEPTQPDSSPPGEPCEEPIGISQKPVLCESPAFETCPEKGCGLRLCGFHLMKHKDRHDYLRGLKPSKGKPDKPAEKKEDFY